MRNSKLVLDGLLGPSQFLNRIVYQQNIDDYGMMDIEYVNILLDEDDDDEDIFSETPIDSPVSSYSETDT